MESFGDELGSAAFSSSGMLDSAEDPDGAATRQGLPVWRGFLWKAGLGARWRHCARGPVERDRVPYAALVGLAGDVAIFTQRGAWPPTTGGAYNRYQTATQEEFIVSFSGEGVSLLSVRSENGELPVHHSSVAQAM